jgi:UDP-N-acetylmuramyl pentapeptide phosphotransferase/UDP-N-acetylglucosamine-1-phosphate transferase
VNHRGLALAFPLGAILVVAAIVALAPLALLNDRAGLELLDPDLRRWIVYLIGIAFLGLLDDGLGLGSVEGTPRGWRGHTAALASGTLSTGAIKAVGALALALYVVTGTGNELPMFLADVLLLILVTNLFNLLDLRGGRVEKVLFTLAAVVCLVAGSWVPIEVTGVFLGPFLVGFWFTLRERAMLGDTGSNLAGAVAGVILLTALDETARLLALAAVVALTVFAEFSSISRAIEKIPPLRFIDSLGRPVDRPVGGPPRNDTGE